MPDLIRYPSVMPDLIRYPLRHAGLDPVSMRRQILVVFWVPGRARDDAIEVARDDALRVALDDALRVARDDALKVARDDAMTQ